MLAQWPTVGTWGEWFAGLATAAAVFVAVRQNDAERDERRQHDRRRIISEVEEALVPRLSSHNYVEDKREYHMPVGLTNKGPRPFRHLVAEAHGRFGGETGSMEERLALLAPGDETSGFPFLFLDLPGVPEGEPIFTIRLTTSEGAVLTRDAEGVYSIDEPPPRPRWWQRVWHRRPRVVWNRGTNDGPIPR